MALNKYMHPRNIYKDPPNFANLAKVYPEFAKVSKLDLAGKVHIDFKDPEALRILTKCLLKSDFNLDVVIPEDRLVPTLPLRLNYILWIEDLLSTILKDSEVTGIDIGTGACAIYPLLAAVKNKWKMIGTESDAESYEKARENVERNNLQSIVTVVKNEANTLIDFLCKENTELMFDFCMCNPPFYSNIQELCESRSTARPPPKNAFTGSPQELITEGGELEFIRRLIAESKLYKQRIRFFTTMVGHKYNLKQLVQELKLDGIKHTETEFCQGRVTRWGLAWTFLDYDFTQTENPKSSGKKAAPVAFSLPPLPDMKYTVEDCLSKIKTMFTNLKIMYKVISKKGASYIIELEAKENTWSNQRRKRRLMKRLEEDNAKKLKLESTEKVNTEQIDSIVENGINSSIQHNLELAQKVQYFTPTEEAPKILVKALMRLFRKETNIILEFEFLCGVNGKEGLHQIVQYIRNNWK